MWIFSDGFISVVAHSEKPDTLLVRARDEGSLLSLLEATGATVRHTPSSDYPKRTEVPRGALSRWLADLVSDLDYTNYKAHMWTKRPEFGDALHDVWVAMHQVTPNGVTEKDRQRAKEWYPNQTTLTDEDLKMMKHLGHL